MANVIKYSTSAPTKSGLSKGDVVMGTGVENYGPTSATGYVSGVDIPVGGYVIYSLHNNNPNAYIAYDDEELIPIANTLGSSTTSIEGAINYLAARGDTWLLNVIPNDIDTDSLMVFYDARDISSYPKSGLNWYNLGEVRGVDGTLINGPTFDNNGYITFDGTNDIVNSNGNVSVSGDQSFETTVKFVDPSNLQGIMTTHDYVNTQNFGVNQVHQDRIGISIGYTNGTREYNQKYTNLAVGLEIFYHIVMTYNLDENQCKLYINGVLDSTFNLTKTVKFTPRRLVLGRWDYSYNGYYFDGNISQAKYYDKTLTVDEVKQNYYQGMSASDDLILYLDADNLCSSWRDGEWRDLSPNNTTINAYGSPTLEVMGGARAVNLNAVGDRFTAEFGSNVNTRDLTWESWIYPAAEEVSSGDRGAIIQGYAYMSWNKSNRRLSSYWYSTNNRGYHEPSKQMARENWHHLLTVWNNEDGKLYQYIDGQLENTITTTAAANAFFYQTINIGWEGNSRQFSGGLGMIKIYNRALTQTEVAQNYDSYKGRFYK